MPSRTSIMDVDFPIQGIDRKWAYQKQPPYTTFDALNVVPSDVSEERLRGGSRPGLKRVKVTQLGSGSPVRLLDRVTVAKSPTNTAGTSGLSNNQESFDKPDAVTGDALDDFSPFWEPWNVVNANSWLYVPGGGKVYAGVDGAANLWREEPFDGSADYEIRLNYQTKTLVEITSYTRPSDAVGDTSFQQTYHIYTNVNTAGQSQNDSLRWEITLNRSWDDSATTQQRTVNVRHFDGTSGGTLVYEGATETITPDQYNGDYVIKFDVSAETAILYINGVAKTSAVTMPNTTQVRWGVYGFGGDPAFYTSTALTNAIFSFNPSTTLEGSYTGSSTTPSASTFGFDTTTAHNAIVRTDPITTGDRLSVSGGSWTDTAATAWKWKGGNQHWGSNNVDVTSDLATGSIATGLIDLTEDMILIADPYLQLSVDDSWGVVGATDYFYTLTFDDTGSGDTIKVGVRWKVNVSGVLTDVDIFAENEAGTRNYTDVKTEYDLLGLAFKIGMFYDDSTNTLTCCLPDLPTKKATATVNGDWEPASGSVMQVSGTYDPDLAATHIEFTYIHAVYTTTSGTGLGGQAALDAGPDQDFEGNAGAGTVTWECDPQTWSGGSVSYGVRYSFTGDNDQADGSNLSLDAHWDDMSDIYDAGTIAAGDPGYSDPGELTSWVLDGSYFDSLADEVTTGSYLSKVAAYQATTPGNTATRMLLDEDWRYDFTIKFAPEIASIVGTTTILGYFNFELHKNDDAYPSISSIPSSTHLRIEYIHAVRDETTTTPTVDERLLYITFYENGVVNSTQVIDITTQWDAFASAGACTFVAYYVKSTNIIGLYFNNPVESNLIADLSPPNWNQAETDIPLVVVQSIGTHGISGSTETFNKWEFRAYSEGYSTGSNSGGFDGAGQCILIHQDTDGDGDIDTIDTGTGGGGGPGTGVSTYQYPAIRYQELLCASSGGTFYIEDTVSSMRSVTSSVNLCANNRLWSTEYLQKLYIADYEDTPVHEYSDGTVTSTTLTSANSVSFSDVTTAHRLVILSGTGVNPGVYEITGVSGSVITCSGGGLGSGSSAKYRIVRSPKVYDPIEDTLTEWVASSGSVPYGKIIVTWHDRLVMAGDPENPYTVSASAMGDALDWDYSSDLETGAWQVAPSDRSATISEPISALIPATDDTLVISSYRGIYLMLSDPKTSNGIIESMTQKVGILSQGAWCQTPERSFICLTRDGLYEFYAAPGSAPQPLSRDRLPQELKVVDPNSVIVEMQYDIAEQAVHIFLSRKDGGTTRHWWYDRRTGSFWKMQLFGTHEPTSTLDFRNLNADLDGVLLGGRDGYIRKYSRDKFTDDGQNFTSSLLIGPLNVSRGNHMEGVVREMDVVLGESTESATVKLAVARTMESAAKQSEYSLSRTVKGGLNPTLRPRSRGVAAIIRIEGISNKPWSLERIQLTLEQAGRLRTR